MKILPPRRFLKRLAVLAAVLAIIGGGAYAWQKHKGAKEAAAGLESRQTAKVTRADIEDVVTSQGKLEPKDYVDVGAQVSGQLETLHAELGQNVKQGDLIAEIDAELYQTQVQGEEANLRTLNAQKAEQEARVVLAQQKAARNKKLVEAKALSVEAYQDTSTDLAVARAQLKSITAQIEQATFELEGNKTNLSFTKIYAPIDGTIVSQSAREGQTLNANQTTPTIVQVANLDTMTVKAQVAEADIVRIVPGTKVYFTILGSQDRRWNASVRQILPTPEVINDVVLYSVMVDVDNKDRQLMSGMSTQMFFVLNSAPNALTVPVSFLGARAPDTENGYKIDVLETGGAIESRTVTIGMKDRTAAEVKAGLEEGETILSPAPKETGGLFGGGRRAMRGMARI